MAEDATVADLIRSRARRVFVSPWKDAVYFGADIPPKKLRNAIDTIAKGINPSRVVALQDWTIFGSAKDGCVFTDASLYYKASYSDPEAFGYRGLVRASAGEKGAADANTLTLEYADGKVRTVSAGNYFDIRELQDFFLAIIDANGRGLTKEVDRFVIVQDMSGDTRLAYLGVLAWLTYQDDQEIDAREMRELQLLITQLEFDAPLRARARALFVAGAELDPEKLVVEMRATAPSGSEDALGVALMRDAIRVHRATSETSALDDPGGVELARLLGINAEQVKVIEEACINDESILSGDISDDELVRRAKDLAAKASAVGVPIAAVYLSGSVAGLSAAGITSGLAALGLGGVLGLSSMVTGIGTVIILGVGTYKGVQWLTGGAERSKASRREFLLKEVLKMHQKAISHLGEDIAYFAEQLVDLTRSANLRQAQVEALARKVQLLANAIAALRAKEETYEHSLELEVRGRLDG